jgi:hypothetical protein
LYILELIWPPRGLTKKEKKAKKEKKIEHANVGASSPWPVA